ncbi:hypothetical protein Rsub_08506 [Raphidocelis subcapitata]|uniref:STEEP1 domain-containing protein n=1 Tax=Raphidocelis subcapitata TaxID=307507 RepID=A0A2V0PEK6_9CHLO|nr:hypothetical protein Rsub_08506 [Raphidocelis subcapitata]|eukprot:GBF95525.1 hypothetical protein Rsub_08506 [Raphidocelis subcapitata]
MPKRTTILYTSSDGLKGAAEDELIIYYCKFSGRHAFTTDVDIDTLPRRRTDGARVLDKGKHMLRLYTTDGGTKLLRRKDGTVERQYRLNVGRLPVAYTAEPDGALVYVLEGAVTAFQKDPAAGDRVPVPPCIRKGDAGSTEVVLELEDRQPHAAVAKITSDAVRVHLTGHTSSEAAAHELLQLMSRVLNMRLTQMVVMRGANSKQRILTVEMLTPRQVYRALRGEAPKPGARGGEEAGGRSGGGGGRGRGRRPWFAGL